MLEPMGWAAGRFQQRGRAERLLPAPLRLNIAQLFGLRPKPPKFDAPLNLPKPLNSETQPEHPGRGVALGCNRGAAYGFHPLGRQHHHGCGAIRSHHKPGSPARVLTNLQSTFRRTGQRGVTTAFGVLTDISYSQPGSSRFPRTGPDGFAHRAPLG